MAVSRETAAQQAEEETTRRAQELEAAIDRLLQTEWTNEPGKVVTLAVTQYPSHVVARIKKVYEDVGWTVKVSPHDQRDGTWIELS